MPKKNLPSQDGEASGTTVIGFRVTPEEKILTLVLARQDGYDDVATWLQSIVREKLTRITPQQKELALSLLMKRKKKGT